VVPGTLLKIEHAKDGDHRGRKKKITSAVEEVIVDAVTKGRYGREKTLVQLGLQFNISSQSVFRILLLAFRKLLIWRILTLMNGGISTASNTQYRSIMQYLGLRKPKVMQFEVLGTDKEVEGFQWGPEKEDAQMDRCLSWLHTISLPPKMQMLSVSGKRDFLNFSFGGSNNTDYLLKGTTDIIIAPTHYVNARNLRGGLRMAIELRKVVDESDRWQTILKLIAVSAFSHFPVAVVLTDLGPCWHFMWFSRSDGIQERQLGLHDGVTLMEDILHERGIYRDMCMMEEAIQAENEAVSRERTGLYDLIPKPDVVNMEDLFEEMSEEEIRQYKYEQAMKYVKSSSLWQTWQTMDA